MTGTVTHLRPGGFDLIASDAFTTPVTLQFRMEEVEAEGSESQRAVQRVGFDRVAAPGNATRFRAIPIQ